jgi:hypothetical protein
MLCLPIFGGPQSSEYPKGKLLGVFATYNKKSDPDQDFDVDFNDQDIVNVRKLLVLAGQGMRNYNSKDLSCVINFFFIAIYNALQLQEVGKRKQDIKLICQRTMKYATLLNNNDTPNDVYKIILNQARTLCQADKASLYILDPTSSALINMQLAATDEKKDPVSISKGVCGYVARTGESVMIKDARRDSRFDSQVKHLKSKYLNNVRLMTFFLA